MVYMKEQEGKNYGNKYNLCAKYVNGFTVHDASGRWNDEKGNTTCEDTIVCYLDDIDEEMIHSIRNIAKIIFNYK